MNNASQMLVWIPLLPLLGALINLTLGYRLGRGMVHLIAVASVAASFGVVLSEVIGPLRDLWLHPEGGKVERLQNVYTWIQAGDLKVDLAFRLDTLSAVMCLVVTGVGTLIHIYSTGYMEKEPRYAAYFGYLNLFTGAMLMLVLGANMPVMFIGWEGVGVCSYLLIGFWFTNPDYAYAGRKAFVVNRIGDFAFLLGMFLLFMATRDMGFASSLDFGDFADPRVKAELVKPFWGGDRMAAAACILLFIGACGKSAQIPLYVWLPDAMAGPTPVSALIHAATMVTAGVYMIARLSWVFALSTTALAVVATIGMLTALFAAFMAFAQTDLKRVLAYSTVSQLGFMFVGVGTGNWVPAIFHLGTHAFFKAGLFLGAGSVMHAMSGSGDIMKMGGLRKLLPITHGTFLVYCLAIAGIFPFAGFFSKDEILAGAWGAHHEGWPAWYGYFLWGGLTIAALGTAFYMWRLYFLVFAGECRADEETKAHIHESPPAMTIPLVILAVLAIVAGFIGLPHAWTWAHDWPYGHLLEHWLEPSLNMETASHVSNTWSYGLIGIATACGIAGILGAWYLYRRGPSPQVDKFTKTESGNALYEASKNKLWVDELYDKTIVRPFKWLADALFAFVDRFLIDTVIVNGSAYVVSLFGRLMRWVQNGQVQRYMVGLILGAALIFWLTSRAEDPTVEYRRVPEGLELKAYAGSGIAGERAKLRWDVDGDGQWDLRPEARERIARLRAEGTKAKDVVIDPKDYVSDPVIVRRTGEVAPVVRLEITDPVDGETHVVSARVALEGEVK
jgi:NADH-quinone oxidoreductase subunit L